MLFRFNIGKSRAGGIGFRSTLIYYMPFWEATRKQRSRVVYRPTPRTFVHLAKTSLMALFLLGCVVWYGGLPWSSSESDEAPGQGAAAPPGPAARVAPLPDVLRRNLPPERLAQLDREEAQRQRENRVQRQLLRPPTTVFDTLGRAAHWVMFVGLAAVAVFPMAGYPLQRVTLERTDDDQLVIRKGGLRPSTRSWPVDAFGQIIYAVEEERMRVRHSSHTIGWLWMVKLQVSPQFVAEHGPSLVDDPEIVFHIDRQKQQPSDMDRPPRSVRVLIKHLRRLTGIRQVGHTELPSYEHGFFTRRRRSVTTTTSTSEPVVSNKFYRTPEEAPEHLRDDIRKLMAEAEANGTSEHRSVRVTFRDSDGNEQTYTSLDDMPPDVRRRYEQAIRSSGQQQNDP